MPLYTLTLELQPTAVGELSLADLAEKTQCVNYRASDVLKDEFCS